MLRLREVLTETIDVTGATRGRSRREVAARARGEPRLARGGGTVKVRVRIRVDAAPSLRGGRAGAEREAQGEER